MPLVYDLETDIRYNQGKDVGAKETQIKHIKKLLTLNLMNLEEIASFAEVDLKIVQDINDKLNSQKN